MSTLVQERPAKPAAKQRPLPSGRKAAAPSKSGGPPENPLTQLRSALGWSRNLMAQVMNCSDRAIVNWEVGEPISCVYASKLHELQTVYDELKALMKPAQVGRWLTTEMDEFEGRSPAETLRRGESGRFWAALFHLRAGTPD
ncbi:MAG: hypothetical protein HYY24_22935 [Verrucomicrobia bacterium]|nr:hypothetical protein [Verrucomicrobiota bacterium]